jgi:hypothetical protein
VSSLTFISQGIQRSTAQLCDLYLGKVQLAVLKPDRLRALSVLKIRSDHPAGVVGRLARPRSVRHTPNGAKVPLRGAQKPTATYKRQELQIPHTPPPYEENADARRDREQQSEPRAHRCNGEFPLPWSKEGVGTACCRANLIYNAKNNSRHQ